MRIASRFVGERAPNVPSLVLLAATVLVYSSAGAATAFAATAAPHWSILSESQPTHFEAAASSDAYVLVVRNNGGAPTAPGSVVTIADTLPEHVTTTKVTVKGEAANGTGSPNYKPT